MFGPEEGDAAWDTSRLDDQPDHRLSINVDGKGETWTPKSDMPNFCGISGFYQSGGSI